MYLWALGIVLLAVYFLPWITARSRRHRNVSAIAVLNFLLGWTVIGWIVALVWSVTANTEEVDGTNKRNKRQDYNKNANEGESWQGWVFIVVLLIVILLLAGFLLRL